MGNELTASKSVDFVLLAADEVCPNSIIADLCPDGDKHSFDLDGSTVHLSSKHGEPDPAADWRDAVAKADAFAIAVQYVDVITMDRLKGIYDAVTQQNDKPFGIFVYRGAGEADYKLSCPHCGQKLWVRDSDVNKRGRCPNCKKAFILPSQGDHVRMRLEADVTIPLASIQGGNHASIQAAFRSILNGSAS